MPFKAQVDYEAIRAEYVSGTAPIRELAKKYGVKQGTLAIYAMRHDWASDRVTVKMRADKALLRSIGQMYADDKRHLYKRVRSITKVIAHKMLAGAANLDTDPQSEAYVYKFLSLKDLDTLGRLSAMLAGEAPESGQDTARVLQAILVQVQAAPVGSVQALRVGTHEANARVEAGDAQPPQGQEPRTKGVPLNLEQNSVIDSTYIDATNRVPSPDSEASGLDRINEDIRNGIHPQYGTPLPRGPEGDPEERSDEAIGGIPPPGSTLPPESNPDLMVRRNESTPERSTVKPKYPTPDEIGVPMKVLNPEDEDE